MFSKTALLGTVAGACVLGFAASADAQTLGNLKALGPAQGAQQVSFDVFLPLRHTDVLEKLLVAQQNPTSREFHKWLTPAQFATRFGPDKTSLSRVAEFLKSRGFAVRVHSRSVSASGTADGVNRSFGVHLVSAQSEAGTTHTVTNESLSLPSELSSEGARIYSFAPHVARVFSAKAGPLPQTASSQNRNSPTGGYWFDDLKEAYHYPSAAATVTVNGQTLPLNGAHAVIGVLMASDVLDSDIKAMFDHENWRGITGKPDPKLAAKVPINGGAKFNLNSGNSVEASLDVQQELTSAPGAAVVLYNVSSLSDGDVVGAYVDIIEQNAVDLLSMSFGECELFYFPRYSDGQDYRGLLRTEHELFMQGNAQGMTFLTGSGDSAGKQCPSPSYFSGGPAKFVVGVPSPADDPNVTALGGTNLVTTYVQGTLDSAYAGENAWDDPEIPYDPYGIGVPVRGGSWGAGSGYSKMWPAPDYQSAVNTGSSMRAIPDIGMQVGGCPAGIAKDFHHGRCIDRSPKDGNGNSQRSAVAVALGVGKGGGFFGVIGTSVSSPEFAGVLAHLIEQKGRLGNVNPYIYRLAAQQAGGGRRSFHTGIPGYNGVEETELNPAYSLSTGVGTPIVTSFIGQPQIPAAGTPQTPSNP